MSSELQKLSDLFTELTEAEAGFRKHSDKFLECRDDIVRHVHGLCRTVARRAYIQIADTGVWIFHLREFMLADTSAQSQ